jgi:hypothetical protein
MGHAVIMNGQFNLLLCAAFGGPSRGASNFFLDENANWTIKDDIAIDPGFGEGIIKINDFIFTTGPRVIPPSMQTESGYPGGVNVVGSIRSGDVVLGRVGDDDSNGLIDGVFMAVGRFPLGSVLLPGAPFVQRFEFVSDIPIAPIGAAFLSVANARNALQQFLTLSKGHQPQASGVDALVPSALDRLKFALHHLVRAKDDPKGCPVRCAEALPRMTTRIELATRQMNQREYAQALEGIAQVFTALRDLQPEPISLGTPAQ